MEGECAACPESGSRAAVIVTAVAAAFFMRRSVSAEALLKQATARAEREAREAQEREAQEAREAKEKAEKQAAAKVRNHAKVNI